MTVALVGSLSLLAISLWMMHKAVRLFDLRSLSVSAIVYFAYLILLYFPGIYIFYFYSDDFAGWFFASLNFFLIAFPGGVILTNLVCSSRADETRNYYNKPVTAFTGKAFEITYVFVLIISAILVAYYLTQVETIPLFYMLTHPGAADTVAQLRESSFKLLSPWGPLVYVFTWLRGMVLPFLTILALGGLLLAKGRRRFWLAMLVNSLLLAAFFASLSVAKAPVAVVFLMLLLAWYLLKSGRIGLRSLAVFGVLILFFPFMVVFIQNGLQLDQFGYAAEGMLVRIFVSPADDLYHYFRVFPDQVDFLMGRSVTWVRLVGLEHFDTANFVALYQNPFTLASASSTVAFTGNLWADFGITGVILGTLLTGVIVQLVQVFLIRQPRNILITSLYAFMCFAFFSLTATSLTTTLVTGGVIPLFILVFVFGGMGKLINQLFLVRAARL
jgi:oligosaccharide repeat unit polymerase